MPSPVNFAAASRAVQMRMNSRRMASCVVQSTEWRALASGEPAFREIAVIEGTVQPFNIYAYISVVTQSNYREILGGGLAERETIPNLG